MSALREREPDMGGCDCVDWKPGTDEVNKHLMTAVARNPHLVRALEYHGPTWRYCPWCGKSLSPAFSSSAVSAIGAAPVSEETQP